MARRPRTNRERALYSAERLGVLRSDMVNEIVTLLEQLHTIEHAQDRAAIRAIADRYGFKMENMGHGR